MKKILIIEDNDIIRENTAEILELADYTVITAENGKKGVELAKSILPDLILCDIMMPDLDGYGVLRILTKNSETSGIPFIFLSAKSEKSDLRKGMNLGADDYITKPFDETDLIEAVEIRIERKERIDKNVKATLKTLNAFFEESRGLDELKDLSKDRKEKNFGRKEKIYHENDYANYLYFIISGKVKCLKTDTFGKEYITEIHAEGDFFGYLTLLDNGEYHETAIALEDSTIAVIPKQDFLSLIQKNRDVSAEFIKLLSGNIREKENRLLQLAYAPVRERVAEALLKHRDTKNSSSISTSLTGISREDLASIVGTTKESLVRMLSELKRDGIIETEGQEIIILDDEGLKKTASGF